MLLYLKVKSNKAASLTESTSLVLVLLLLQNEVDDELSEEQKIEERSGRYELIGFVSHIGANATCGHYVCHVKQDNQWIMFNDNKVFISQKPPTTRGYIYLYRAVD